jgi:hypothetical protein
MSSFPDFIGKGNNIFCERSRDGNPNGGRFSRFSPMCIMSTLGAWEIESKQIKRDGTFPGTHPKKERSSYVISNPNGESSELNVGLSE